MTTYASHEHHDFLGASTQALADPPLQAALVRLTSTLMAGNQRGYANLADSDKLRDHAKHIKEHALAHLDRYLEQLEASVQGNLLRPVRRKVHSVPSTSTRPAAVTRTWTLLSAGST